MASSPERRVDSFLADLRRESHPPPQLQQPQPQHQHQPQLAQVDVATSPSSSLCRTAMLILDDLGIAYRELEVGRDVSEAQLVERKGGPFAMLPLLFVDDRFVGGFPELKALGLAGVAAVLGAGVAAAGSGGSGPAPSPRIFEKLHYEAEANEARRAALQRHGLAYGLNSPLSPEKDEPARPSSPLLHRMRPNFHSPGRELVVQERSGVGIRAVIDTERAGMRYDSPHRAVRCGGGWQLPERAPPRRRARALSPKRNIRTPPYPRTPARLPPAPVPAPPPAPALAPARRGLDVQQLQERIAHVTARLEVLGAGVSLGGLAAGLGTAGSLDFSLLGLDGAEITAVRSDSRGGAHGVGSGDAERLQKLSLLLSLLEGACGRVERQEDG